MSSQLIYIHDRFINVKTFSGFGPGALVTNNSIYTWVIPHVHLYWIPSMCGRWLKRFKALILATKCKWWLLAHLSSRLLKTWFGLYDSLIRDGVSCEMDLNMLCWWMIWGLQWTKLGSKDIIELITQMKRATRQLTWESFSHGVIYSTKRLLNMQFYPDSTL